jgi:hypothetical protein
MPIAVLTGYHFVGHFRNSLFGLTFTALGLGRLDRRSLIG